MRGDWRIDRCPPLTLVCLYPEQGVIVRTPNIFSPQVIYRLFFGRGKIKNTEYHWLSERFKFHEQAISNDIGVTLRMLLFVYLTVRFLPRLTSFLRLVATSKPAKWAVISVEI